MRDFDSTPPLGDDNTNTKQRAAATGLHVVTSLWRRDKLFGPPRHTALSVDRLCFPAFLLRGAEDGRGIRGSGAGRTVARPHIFAVCHPICGRCQTL